jgi:hypothetical protein
VAAIKTSVKTEVNDLIAKVRDTGRGCAKSKNLAVKDKTVGSGAG